MIFLSIHNSTRPKIKFEVKIDFASNHSNMFDTVIKASNRIVNGLNVKPNACFVYVYFATQPGKFHFQKIFCQWGLTNLVSFPLMYCYDLGSILRYPLLVDDL